MAEFRRLSMGTGGGDYFEPPEVNGEDDDSNTYLPVELPNNLSQVSYPPSTFSFSDSHYPSSTHTSGSFLNSYSSGSHYPSNTHTSGSHYPSSTHTSGSHYPSSTHTSGSHYPSSTHTSDSH